MKHIQAAFNEIALKYDQQRRDLIPCFDDFYGTIINLINSEKPGLKILDIGAGTGLLAKMALDKYPTANLTLIDLSEDMLSIAKKRFAGNSRISFITADYSNYIFNSKFDVVMSSLSIHHLDDNEKKRLYGSIFNILNEGGKFINGDLFLSRNPQTDDYFHKLWVEKIERSPLSREEKEGAYNRMKLDKPSTLENTFNALEKTGFKCVEMIYKYYNFGVVVGEREW